MSELTQSIGRVGRSPAFKLFLIAFVILMLLVPLLMVAGLVYERAGRASEAESEVARTWGAAQQVAGPFLVVPYQVRLESIEGEKTVVKMVNRQAVFMPEELNIAGETQSQVLHRSIFDINVYTASLTVEGRFRTPEIADADPNAISVDWRGAALVMVFSSVSGLKEASPLKINGAEELPFDESPMLPGSTLQGIHVKLGKASSLATAGDAPLQPFSFHAVIKLTGSKSLAFAPAARETRVSLVSDWPHPSFTGSFLPAERAVTDRGFTASWRVPHLARSVAQAASPADGGISSLASYYFGVGFYQPVDFYDLVTRAVKYGVLFLAIAFMAVFMLEIASGQRVHPVQYLFVGLAMIFFYVLLLSLSEHIGFTASYVAASAATGGMLSLYAGKALGSARSGLIMLGLFAGLYAFLYLVLTLEDYALLAGALLGFASLTIVMFKTLRIDWSSAGVGPAQPAMLP